MEKIHESNTTQNKKEDMKQDKNMKCVKGTFLLKTFRESNMALIPNDRTLFRELDKES